MDPFVVVVLVVVGTLVGAALLLGRLYPGSGADLLDWRSTHSSEVKAEREVEDVRQMVDAQNELRRKRGAPEVTEGEVRDSVLRQEQQRLADADRLRE